MIPEIGHVALILALALAIIQAVFPVVGAHKGIHSWVALARPVARTQLLFMLVSYGFGFGELVGDPTWGTIASWFQHKPWEGVAPWGGVVQGLHRVELYVHPVQVFHLNEPSLGQTRGVEVEVPGLRITHAHPVHQDEHALVGGTP